MSLVIVEQIRRVVFVRDFLQFDVSIPDMISEHMVLSFDVFRVRFYHVIMYAYMYASANFIEDWLIDYWLQLYVVRVLMFSLLI